MPKSKRNKLVHLTQVKKKGKDHKEDLMKQIEQYVAQFSRVYLFDFDSTKADRIMVLRVRLKEFGRIFAGRNAVVGQTFKTIASKSGTNYDDLIKNITGHRGLLFTDMSLDKLIEIIDAQVPDFREKLLGYAQITPEVREMEIDSAESRNDGKNDGAASKNKELKKKKKPETMSVDKLKSKSKKGHEVKFVVV